MYIFNFHQNYTREYVPDLIPCMVDTASLKGTAYSMQSVSSSCLTAAHLLLALLSLLLRILPFYSSDLAAT